MTTTQAQPVAWIQNGMDILRHGDDTAANWLQAGWKPLYTTPQSAPAPTQAQPARTLTEADLPDHPEFNTMKWSKLEKEAILEWANITLKKTNEPT